MIWSALGREVERAAGTGQPVTQRQNIPVRTKEGKQIRKAFIADDGHVLLVSDLAQIEPRIAAGLSQDPNMCHAILHGLDFHCWTASLMFGEKYEEVVEAKKAKDGHGELTEQQKYLLECRRQGKTIGLGLMYGEGAEKLAGQLDIPKEDAEDLVGRYHASYPDIRPFFDGCIEFANETEFIATLLGRRRQLKAINSPDYRSFSEACRQAQNTPVQGCLPARTRILTVGGYIPIGEAPKHGCVWTGTGWGSYVKMSRGSCQLAEICLSNGQILPCDTRHEVLVEDPSGYEFRHFRDLRVGDRICLSLASQIEFGVSTHDRSTLYWLGFALGNGCSGKYGWRKHHNNLTITFGDRIGRYVKEAKAEEFEMWLRQNGERPQKPKVSPNKISISVESGRFRRWWEADLGYPWGLSSHDKVVPASVWSASSTGRLAFLTGLLDADGGVGDGVTTPPNLHLGQRRLLEEVQVLLRTCGVESILRGPYEASWRLDINGGQAAKELGYGRRDRTILRMPSPPFIVADYLGKSSGSVPAGSHTALRNRMRAGGTTSIYTLRDMYRREGLDLPLMYAAYELIEKRELPVVEETFTLSIDDHLHRFDSEGVISKNTAAEIMKRAQILIYLDDELREAGVRALMQVHDEIILEVPQHLRGDQELVRKVERHMCHPFLEEPLLLDDGTHIPIKTDPAFGDNWLEAK